MTMHERTGTRSLVYSSWHRQRSISRYLRPIQAGRLTVIDIDWCEYCSSCGEPLALIETQESTSPPKDANVTSRLAQLADLPAFSVSYEVANDDIVRFQERALQPLPTSVRSHTPEEYARFLWSLHAEHDQHCIRQAGAA